MVRITKPIRIFPVPERGQLKGSIRINGEEVKQKASLITIQRRTTTGLSSANLEITNPDQTFTNKWSGGEVIEIYADLTDGTTKVFEGYITKVSDSYNRFPSLTIEAKDYGVEAFHNPVFKIYTTDTDIGQIAKELIEEYLPTHTTTGINTSTGVTAAPSWQGKDLFMCLKDLAVIYGNGNYHFFCDFDKDWQFFEKGSRKHGSTSGVAAIYGQNMRILNLDSMFLNKRNKITVIGQSIDNMPLMATKKDNADISNYWTIHEIIKDTNLTTQEDVENQAQFILNTKMLGGRVGTVTTDLMPSVQPGYDMMIFSPPNNANGYFHTTEITHTIGRNTRTIIKIHESDHKTEKMEKFLENTEEQFQRELDIQNDYAMENSYTFTFDDDSELTLTDTIVSNSQLLLASGKSTGYAVTDTKETDEDITQVVLKIDGYDLQDSKFYIAVDRSVSWEEVTPNTLHTVSSTGKWLKIKVVLNSSAQATNPALNSMSCLYK